MASKTFNPTSVKADGAVVEEAAPEAVEQKRSVIEDPEVRKTNYKRKCANWLLTFRDWTLPRSEAPESYHMWAGLFTLASVLNRKVMIPKRIFGGWSVSPTLYVIFVAPPGQARKSTTAGYTEELLAEIPTVTRVATSITKEQMLKKLAETRDSSLSIFSSEFAMFIQKSGPDMYDVLTHLFDGNRDVSVETIGRPMDFAEKPCVNLLACTTPDWISNNMPEYVIGGGFASRVIFVFEERARRFQLYYDEDTSVDWKHLEKLKGDLLSDLAHIATSIEGEFDISAEARAYLEPWYRATAERNESGNHRLGGYFQRKPAHVHKIAMLLHLAYDDELIITLEDAQGAMAILDDLERNLPQTFEQIGSNPYTVDMIRILNFIKQRKVARKRDVMAAFYQSADPRKLQELITGLAEMGKIRIVADEEDPHSQSKMKLIFNRD